MQVTSISAFRANIKQYYDNVLLTEEPLIITKGDTGAVLIPLNEYNAMQRRLETIEQLTKQTFPFLIVMFIVLMMITYIPDFSLALPRALGLM